MVPPQRSGRQSIARRVADRASPTGLAVPSGTLGSLAGMAVTLLVHDDSIDLQITGWFDRAMCLSSGLTLPLTEITGARLVGFDEAKASIALRVGGTWVPGLIATGWYAVRGRRGARELWAVFRDREQVLVIDTTLDRPCRIVLGHPDRERLAWWINERLAGAPAA